MYFVVYDQDDNVVAYIDSLDELISFFELKSPKKSLNFLWKRRKSAQLNYLGTSYQIYRFS